MIVNNEYLSLLKEEKKGKQIHDMSSNFKT